MCVYRNGKFSEYIQYLLLFLWAAVTKRGGGVGGDLGTGVVMGSLHALSHPEKVYNVWDSATWYSTHTCSTLLMFIFENCVFI
jgi:hypothetical protein